MLVKLLSRVVGMGNIGNDRSEVRMSRECCRRYKMGTGRRIVCIRMTVRSPIVGVTPKGRSNRSIRVSFIVTWDSTTTISCNDNNLRRFPPCNARQIKPLPSPHSIHLQLRVLRRTANIIICRQHILLVQITTLFRYPGSPPSFISVHGPYAALVAVICCRWEQRWIYHWI